MNGKAKMSKDYQKEVVNFLKPTSVKMNLSEGRSPYPKVDRKPMRILMIH